MSDTPAKTLQGTKTLLNLMRAFAGESQARNRYTFYAAVARKAGYKQIEAIFLETAENELDHAKQFYRLLAKYLGATEPVLVDLQGTYPIALGETLDNLLAAAAGEREEWSTLYPDFAETAQQEGFADVAAMFRIILTIEQHHDKRFAKLAANLAGDAVFCREQPVFWKCIKCGYVVEALKAPEICPGCKHPQAYFEILAENY